MPQRLMEVAPGVVTQTSNLYQVNSTVISGAAATVVADPAWYPDEIAALQSLVATTPIGRATHVLFTHGDWDHYVGWADFGDITLLAHPACANRDAERINRKVALFDADQYTERAKPFSYPPAAAFTLPTALTLGSDQALFFSAPGHVADAVFTVLAGRGVLIAGDYLSDLEFPFVYHSWKQYRATLVLARDLCDRHGLTRLVPGHGHVAMTRGGIDFRIDSDIDYLDRLAGSVRDATAAGWTADEAGERLREFSFRGQPVAEHLVSGHVANIKFAYEHQEELR